MFKRIILNPFVLFPLLTCIFFWPVSLKIFTFKNDALTYYYPVRTLISDAINNSELPLWTPFINMGYPLHADMQSGAWNPVISIIGLLTNYNLAAFHYELLIYLAMAGIGFYFLARDYGWSRFTALLIGAGYEFCGPIIDSVQFTACISSACYIPFIFLFFRRLLHLKRPVFSGALAAVFLYLLFTGGYPAMFIITIYLLTAFMLYACFSTTNSKAFLKKLLVPCGLLTGIFILLSLPAIISFANYLKFIDRGKALSLDFVLENSMPPSCMFSLISPFSTTATNPFFDTNLLMRNIYLGIVPLVFLIYSICNKALRNNRELQFIFFSALILFGMAWGSHFFLRQLAYYTLPLMNTFRHPALFRFFGVFLFLLASGFGINQWNNSPVNNNLLKQIILSIGALVILTVILVLVFSGGNIVPPAWNTGEAKNLIHSLSFQQRFLIQLPFLAITLSIFYLLVSKEKSLFYITCLSIADLFFATQLNMPVTVVGSKDFTTMESLINRNPVKFPLPGGTTIEQNAMNSFDSTHTLGSRLPFEKKIGRNDYFITPGNLSSQDKFYESSIREPVFKNAILYFADSVLPAGFKGQRLLNAASSQNILPTIHTVKASHFNTDSIEVKSLSANTLECIIITAVPRLLIFLQNSYPGWKVFIDGKEAAVMTTNISFMGVSVPAGKHTITFRYRPAMILYAWYISLFTMAGIIFFIGYHIFSDQHNKRNTKGKLYRA